MYVQPFEGSLNAAPLSPFGEIEGGEGAPVSQPLMPPGTPVLDGIARSTPPWPSGNGADPSYGGGSSMQGPFGALMGMLQQLIGMLQQMMGYGGGSPYGNEQYFQNATGSSRGDPHLSFDGSTWNSMVSQPDLLNSDSFPGGFQISTQVTSPNAKGVTHNQSATISMNGGATTVTLNNNGQASITSYGRNVSIAPGQTVQLGNGESVACSEDGSLNVVARNGAGGQIDTTLAAKNGGVNVGVTAHDVDLGGALVNGGSQSPLPPGFGPVSAPIPGTLVQPVPGPIPYTPVVPPIDGMYPETQ